MARPLKKGIDYFPLDCNPDRKTKILIRKFGLVGEGVFISLLKAIYLEGYYHKIDDDFIEEFCIDFNLEEGLFNDILDFLLRKNFFSEKMFKKYKILTSSGIQKRFKEATKKRNDNYMKDEFLVNDDNNPINDDNNPSFDTPKPPSEGVNDGDSTQSKVKKRKEDESKEEKRKVLEESFETWWGLYDKKVGKKKAQSKWMRLNDEDRAKCLMVVKDYVASRPTQYKKNPEGYLNGEMWNDEIQQSQPSQQFQPRKTHQERVEDAFTEGERAIRRMQAEADAEFNLNEVFQ